MEDLENRNIYKFIDSILFPKNTLKYNNDIIAEFLQCGNPKDDFYLTKKDIEFIQIYFDYGNGSKNPFNSIFFYNPNEPNRCFVKHQKNTLNMPEVFKELKIYVIWKNSK